MTETLLFEIGAEEMPAKQAREGARQLRVNAEKLLEERRLTGQGRVEVETYATPRRLVLVVKGLSEKQSSVTENIKGPPRQAAFTPDGAPAPAALGFAKSQGVAVDDLEVREVEGRTYVYAVRQLPGLATESVLPEMLAQLVRSLEFPKAMRWGSGELRFIRPIRWLLALYGDRLVPLQIDGLASGRLTWGHRFLAEGPFELARAGDYERLMAEGQVVIASDEGRRAAIEERIKSAASAVGGRAFAHKRDYLVLEEVAYLVEDPYVVIGRFDEDFLKLPAAVLVTAMESHQRYFPLVDDDGNLMPHFAVVHNGDPAFDEQIRHGHQRVLRARLADAAFFFGEDTKTSLDSKVDRLKGVVWQAKLGTVYDKVERMRRLGGELAAVLALSPAQTAALDRAIWLAKADLTTSMVIEFPELQGVVGNEYALVDGEPREVANAISAHYRPRFAGDELPDELIGRALGLVDKLDTVVGCFLVGLVPSGSADPYSLRRQAVGIIGILGETRWKIGILELVDLAVANYLKAGLTPGEPETVALGLQEFILGRLKRWLIDSGSSPEAIESVLAAGLDQVGAVTDRVRLIDGLRGKKELEDIKIAFTRCQNLSDLEKGEDVREDLFESDEERNLFRDCLAAGEDIDLAVAEGRLDQAANVLAGLRGPIDEFFEAVLIMAPQPEVRDNRLKLLNMCVSRSRRLADFSKLG
jgi:glycyl-tRNA synthetase beta chain